MFSIEELKRQLDNEGIEYEVTQLRHLYFVSVSTIGNEDIALNEEAESICVSGSDKDGFYEIELGSIGDAIEYIKDNS